MITLSSETLLFPSSFSMYFHILWLFRFQPPDACYIEIMRFRIRPPKARELPMQARCIFEITGNKVKKNHIYEIYGKRQEKNALIHPNDY